MLQTSYNDIIIPEGEGSLFCGGLTAVSSIHSAEAISSSLVLATIDDRLDFFMFKVPDGALTTEVSASYGV